MLIGNELLIGRTLESDCLMDCAAEQATPIADLVDLGFWAGFQQVENLVQRGDHLMVPG